MGPPAQSRDIISFGPFALVARERLLTRHGVAVELGARSLDILISLLSRPNETVSKSDLLAQVWPGVTVEESSLRFHIASLRKALGDGKDGARYIETVSGRGYCFVAPVLRSNDRVETEASTVLFPHANLPVLPIGIVGRDGDVLELSSQLNAARFVTIVGAGGIGKTTVAVAVGHRLIDAFAGAVLFVDLSMLTDSGLVSTAVANMLALSVRFDDATSGLIAYLRDKRILLILDTCEHLIEAVAALTSRIFAEAPHVHILATSRETLQVEGEHVYRLDPLACPPDDPGLTAAVARTFPATQLFVERAVASGAHLDLSDADAAIVVSICRKLDGVALAIELAARRVEAYGLYQTAALLDQRLTRLWLGPRTAPPRQRTLQATLDWSYALLSEMERLVLRRLAIFVGHFTLDAALAVVTSATIDRAVVFAAIDTLVAKSMLAPRPIGAMMRYRLLDTTRAYALEIGIDDAEATDSAVRHATYFRKWLEQNGAEWPTLSSPEERAPYFAALGNVRAALDWCFGVKGNVDIGIGLAVAAAPVFLAMSLLPECHRWSERALTALDDVNRGGAEEMHLQAAVALSLMFTSGSTDAALAASRRSLAIAEQRRDNVSQLKLLAPLQMLHIRLGEFKTALRYARRTMEVAAPVGELAALGLAHSLLGNSLHFVGDHSSARANLEAALRTPRSSRASTIYLGFDHHNRASITLARTLWLQGYPEQAVQRARQTIAEAAAMDHPVTLYLALIWAVPIFFWTGDLDSAEEYTGKYIAHAETHSLGPYLAVGRGFKAALAIGRGFPKTGIDGLMTSLEELHAVRYEVVTTTFNIALVQGLTATARFAEGITLINETMKLVEANGALSYMPEVLRVKGSILLSMPQPSGDEAETCFIQSLHWSRRQTARSWELRTAIDLAALWASRSRTDAARTVLQPVFEQFVEGFDTADLKAAERLLAALR